MKKSILFLALGGIIMTAFNSCEELETLCPEINEEGLNTGEVFVTSLNHMVDVYKRVDAANKNPVVLGGGSEVIDGASCSIVGDSLFIDFGIADVVCADNKLRKGSIRSLLINDYVMPNGEANAILSNYFVDGTQLTGEFAAKNNGPAADPDFSISTTNFKVGEESSVVYTLGALWGQGFTTSDATDDIFDISGNLSGEDISNSKNFTANVTEQLHYVNACEDIIEKGMIEIKLTEDSITFIVDFIESDGCNNLFNVTADCQGSPISFTYPMN